MAYAAGAWAGGRSEGGESEKVGSFGATLQSLSPLCSDASLLKEEICCTRSYGGRARGRWLKCRGPGRGCSTSPRLEASTNQELDQHIPLFNLPSKILCRVVDVHLKVELLFFPRALPFFHLSNLKLSSKCNRGECGELRVGVRRQARQQAMIPTSVISSQSMHLGVLATASHAVTTHTLFTVYYKPRFGT
ncbi:hypothetical protein B296_00044229 [Ensete ventricosum]|uniref:Uncharacterized protein n=1 Tax=Ensete ventricosum TaxID=4639 RepID=A0A426XID5_ENSVE|nr:hypothetical protein B296_00044229 [Ensete ventricosum]